MGILWKNSKGSFTKYPLGTLWTLRQRTKGVHSKSTHWVLYWVLFESAHHLPAGYEPGELMGTFWKRPICTCWVFFWVNWWVLFKSAHYLPAGFGLGEWVGTFWKCPPCTHWVWAGRIVSEPTMNSQCTHWVYCPSPPVWGAQFSLPRKEQCVCIHQSRLRQKGWSALYKSCMYTQGGVLDYPWCDSISLVSACCSPLFLVVDPHAQTQTRTFRVPEYGPIAAPRGLLLWKFQHYVPNHPPAFFRALDTARTTWGQPRLQCHSTFGVCHWVQVHRRPKGDPRDITTCIFLHRLEVFSSSQQNSHQ